MSANPALVFDAVRLEPNLSVTTTVVDDPAQVELAVRELDARLVTLLVRRIDEEAPSVELFERAWSTIVATRDLEQARALLKFPVLSLPGEKAGWSEAVRTALRDYPATAPRHAPVLFVRLTAAPRVPGELANQVRSAWTATTRTVLTWLGNRRVGAAPVTTAAAVPAPETAAIEGAVSPLDAAIAHRDGLLKSERWLSSTEVAAQARGGEALTSNPHQHASRLRKERRLFGVRLGGQYLHPAFQFQQTTGEPHTALPALLGHLPDEDHGWAAALWLFAPTRKLDGARPADVFLEQPEAVIDAARRDFEGDNADW